MVAYVVEKVDAVWLIAGEPLKSMDWMSPYVWTGPDRKLWMMMRGVPNPFRSFDPTGIIWCGSSEDGLTFQMDDRPVIVPGPESIDTGGVEDPTVVQDADGLTVYYTGVQADRRQGSLLLATGPDPYSLEKREVILKAPEGEGNFKEATLFQAPDKSWRLFYEFARDGASRIGMARATELGSEWTSMKDMIPIREDSWDNWHLSTGPIVQRPDRDPVMFYNGATDDARWRIGWITFDQGCECITDRGVEPLLMPPPATDREATDIAFAASAVLQQDGTIHLYYSLEDRKLSRALVRAYD
ncbi:MAG: glycosidase [Pseudomonadota bacterium]|nr:glycosidase [Pseudomonadota bacterium]